MYDKWVRLRGFPALAISGAPGDTLANDLLTDAADWNAEYWSLVPDALPSIAGLVSQIFAASAHGVLFRAIWVGDRSDREVEIPLDGLAKSILDNRVPNKATVVVPKPSIRA